MSTPIISVIIPTYKPGEYLWSCLDSLYKQTLPRDQFEIIIVLNGDINPYDEMIEKYIALNQPHNNVQLITSIIAGVSKARNMALDLARGQYVCFIDDDDWVSDNYLEQLLIPAKQHSIIVANVKCYIESAKVYTDDYISKAYSAIYKETNVSCLKARSFFGSACCKLISKDCINNRRFNTDFKIGEDSLFMFSISDKISTISTASSNAIYYRRVRSSSVSQTKKSINILLQQAVRQAKAYTGIYLSNIRGYSFLFFLTRYLAIVKNLIIK